jgi:hypothetical protein
MAKCASLKLTRIVTNRDTNCREPTYLGRRAIFLTFTTCRGKNEAGFMPMKLFPSFIAQTLCGLTAAFTETPDYLLLSTQYFAKALA